MFRSVRYIMLLLMLAFVMNVAVAWFIAALGSITPTRGFRVADAHHQALWAEQRPQGLNSIARMSASSRSRGFDAHLLIGSASRTFDVNVDDRGRVRDFGWTGRQDEIDHKPLHWALFVRTGWPLRCMYGSRWSEQWNGQVASVQAGLAPANPTELQHVLAMPLSQLKRSGSESRFMPLGILPWAFLLNALCYAALLWLLISVPVTVRRVRRRQRGLCGKCAYPVGTSTVCSECGSAIPQSQCGAT